MSRVGKKPIPLSDKAGIQVTIGEGRVTVKGPKGVLHVNIPEGIGVEKKDSELVVTRQSDSLDHRAKHGLIRTLTANAVEGVTKGYQKNLEIVGIGYKAVLDGNVLVLNIGYSSPVRYSIPPGIEIKIEKATKILIAGIDKEQVGEVAAQVRRIKIPDVYKGKGIRYEGEHIKLKDGKTGA
jgi:large subunit ribosomal protein L6